MSHFSRRGQFFPKRPAGADRLFLQQRPPPFKRNEQVTPLERALAINLQLPGLVVRQADECRDPGATLNLYSAVNVRRLVISPPHAGLELYIISI